MNEENLITYYNKFNEEKRLNSKYGQVEFITTIEYINKYLKKGMKIADIGAGAGAYSKYYSDLGFDITPVELIKHNVRKIESLGLKAYQGNATNLSFLESDSYDIVFLFGPLYHLIAKEEKIKALNEAKRIVKKDGLIFISYILNDYAVIYRGFIEGAIIEEKNNNKINDKYITTPSNDDLYSYVTLNDIYELSDICNLERIQIISQDGPASYIRPYLNKLNDLEFKEFINFHLNRCEDKNILGASAHVLDILKK